MKASFLICMLAFQASLALHADTSPAEQPNQMAPYTVKESPFGFLGIKHASIGINPFKFLVGMDSVNFLQIDELDPLSPGIAAGIKAGDRIVTIDKVPVTKFGVMKLRHLGDTVEVGQRFVIETFRSSDNSTRTMEVVVPRKPKMPNQLPDPTSPSVTPPAVAGSAPSVTANH
jgi:membrane-associated protease RseP (regulator of RpoE activity)